MNLEVPIAMGAACGCEVETILSAQSTSLRDDKSTLKSSSVPENPKRTKRNSHGNIVAQTTDVQTMDSEAINVIDDIEAPAHPQLTTV